MSSSLQLEHMHKKFEINGTKIKGGCQSRRKVVAHNSKSDLPLVSSLMTGCHAFLTMRLLFICTCLTAGYCMLLHVLLMSGWLKRCLCLIARCWIYLNFRIWIKISVQNNGSMKILTFYVHIFFLELFSVSFVYIQYY